LAAVTACPEGLLVVVAPFDVALGDDTVMIPTSWWRS